MNSDEISVIGFFFTLVGLLGTYFYIHLGNWYTEVIDLKRKYDRSLKTGKRKGEEQRTLRDEYKKLFTFVPLLTTCINTFFTLVVSSISFRIICDKWSDILAKYLGLALLSFLIIYMSLIVLFLGHGYYNKKKMKDDLQIE